MQSLPTKTTYNVNDSLDTSGLTLIYYANCQKQIITSGFSVSAPSLSALGTYEVSVTYEGLTTSFEVSVTAYLYNKYSFTIPSVVLSYTTSSATNEIEIISDVFETSSGGTTGFFAGSITYNSLDSSGAANLITASNAPSWDFVNSKIASVLLEAFKSQSAGSSFDSTQSLGSLSDIATTNEAVVAGRWSLTSSVMFLIGIFTSTNTQLVLKNITFSKSQTTATSKPSDSITLNKTSSSVSGFGGWAFTSGANAITGEIYELAQ